MIAEMSKIQIAIPISLQDDLLRWLQDEEVLQITPIPHESAVNQPLPSNTAYRLANLQFGLDFIARVRRELHIEQKKDWRHLFSSKPIANLVQLENTTKNLDLDTLFKDIHDMNNTLNKLDIEKRHTKEKLAEVSPWQNLRLMGKQLNCTPGTHHYLLVINTRDEDLVINMLQSIDTVVWQEVGRLKSRKTTRLYLEVVVHERNSNLLTNLIHKLNAQEVTFELANDESLRDYARKLEQQLGQINEKYETTLNKAKNILPLERKLQFAYDALLHRQERELISGDVLNSSYAAVLSGWIPRKWLPRLNQRLSEHFPTAYMQKINPAKKEVAPITFDNKAYLRPFEAITNIYGKPGPNELDPSPALAIFFLIAFGLALSDAGYGLLMLLGLSAAIRFFRLKRETKKMFRLLSYAGGATAIVGLFTGSWFGIDLMGWPPGPIRELLLSFKLIDPVTEPMTLLMIAFALGIIQLLFAWVVRGYSNFKTGNKAAIFLDDIPWITMVIFLLAWVGTKQNILPTDWETPFFWLVIANTGFLILTQGRAQKNPFLRLASGVLSLYGLVGFLSDTLSYSRLLALGLATSIIGLVVNMIASMTNEIPVVGIALAVIVLLVGHAFNLGINTLGAFIHSGRLQFVEFFPKFMEGGGRAFKPFGRTGRYVDNPKEFI